MSSLGTPDPHPGWLSEEDLTHVRHRLPLLYVEAIPVRQDEDGSVTEVGLLLRADAGGAFKRTIVSGRVLYAETVRSALLRHLEKDLGPMALPRLPASPTPFTVAEYFPLPGLGRFSDERQHAVSLVFVVPVTGHCEPRQDALELTWFSPREAVGDGVTHELEGGRGALIRAAMAHVGALD
ncbi:NUDIX hydrolase family protein [Desertihabitans aurantiacus]|uniref:NUDIX hydrolase family protein n=1 Tax=Desertihabitans aurantiacus TaxID=2282477 RepID=UPI000DF7596B|nr:NUDIX hydrolase family protein [Desertihabitans aurantiacus]